MSNCAYQLRVDCDDALSAEKIKTALMIADLVAKSHPEHKLDKVRLMNRNAVCLDARETCAPAFAAACMLLGVID